MTFTSERIKQYAKGKKIPQGSCDVDYWLFDSCLDLTDEERRLRVENAFVEALLNIATRYAVERAKDYIARLKQGQKIPPEVLSEMQQEMFASAMDKEARECETEHFTLALRLGSLQAHHRDYAQAMLEGLSEIPYRMKPYKKWIIDPSTLQVLSRKDGYDGNFYSWFFKVKENKGQGSSQEFDDKFFSYLKTKLEEGASEKQIVDGLYQLMGDKDSENPILTRGRLKNIARTETVRAMEQGRVQESAQLGIVKAYMFSAVDDVRTSEYCLLRDGLLISATDPLLTENLPPLHYMCRSTLSPISRRKLERLGGEERLAYDRDRLLDAPKFDWHGKHSPGTFAEADIPES